MIMSARQVVWVSSDCSSEYGLGYPMLLYASTATAKLVTQARSKVHRPFFY